MLSDFEAERLHTEYIAHAQRPPHRAGEGTLKIVRERHGERRTSRTLSGHCARCSAAQCSQSMATSECGSGDLLVADELHAVVANQSVLCEVVVVVVLVTRTERRQARHGAETQPYR